MQILDTATQGTDPVMKHIATECKRADSELHKYIESFKVGTVKSQEKSYQPIKKISEFPERISEAFSQNTTEWKDALLTELNNYQKTLQLPENKKLHLAVIDALKKAFQGESTVGMRGSILTAIAKLDASKTSVAFLNSIVNDAKAPKSLKKHAAFLKQAIEDGVFGTPE